MQREARGRHRRPERDRNIWPTRETTRDGRFVVTIRKGGSPYVDNTGYDGILKAVEASDCWLFWYALPMTEGLWRKVEELKSVGGDLDGRFARYPGSAP